jgi:hypothetical protein
VQHHFNWTGKFHEEKNMTDHDEVVDLHPVESSEIEDDEGKFVSEPIKQANTSKQTRESGRSEQERLIRVSFTDVNQDYSKRYVRLTIRIPHMKTGLNWRRMTREAKNGLTTKATYHGT